MRARRKPVFFFAFLGILRNDSFKFLTDAFKLTDEEAAASKRLKK